MTQPSRPAQSAMRVVLWGTCDTGKPRVRILRDGLRARGVDVVECRIDVWGGVQDKSQAGIGRWLGLLARIVLAYPVLAWHYLRLPRHDWVLLGYPAIPDVFVIRLLAWLRGAKVAMDWFLCAYDTVVSDRKLVGPRHPLALLLWGTEWLAIRLADCVFMDTQAHARRMEQLFQLDEGRCGSVWVGVEHDVFAPQSVAPARPDAALRVLFYGQFIPLHGAATIVQAAQLLRDEPVDWLLIGRGQDGERIRRLLESDPLPRLRWLEWVDYPRLVEHIGAADLCLGIFGTSEKAASVIPNKVFQVLAAGRPIVTRDSAAIRELLGHQPPCSYLVPADDPQALAGAVRAHATMRAANPSPSPCHAGLSTRIHAGAIGDQLLTLLTTSFSRETAR
ncbi:MAG TPA: glycosyltransferase [Nitrobacter sp.]|nr:glycosyltransferase [Nitrobacter sp.]